MSFFFWERLVPSCHAIVWAELFLWRHLTRLMVIGMSYFCFVFILTKGHRCFNQLNEERIIHTRLISFLQKRLVASTTKLARGDVKYHGAALVKHVSLLQWKLIPINDENSWNNPCSLDILNVKFFSFVLQPSYIFFK